jgi:hypothetical protein
MQKIYYVYSESQGKVIEVNDTRAATTQELAIKRYFAFKRKMIDRQEEEVLARLSKETMADLADRD